MKRGLPASLLATAAAFAQPVDTAGTWSPISRALEPLGPLTIGPTEIRWSICRDARVIGVASEPGGTVYRLDGQPGCVLDGQRLTHLKLVPRANAASRCGAELSLFGSEKAWRGKQPESWGLVEKSPCP